MPGVMTTDYCAAKTRSWGVETCVPRPNPQIWHQGLPGFNPSSPFFAAFWQFIYNFSLHSKYDNLKNIGKQPWPAQCIVFIYVCRSTAGRWNQHEPPQVASSAQHQQHICSGRHQHSAVYHHLDTAALQAQTAWLQ